MNLFQRGSFVLASGRPSTWKLECDSLTPADWQGVAHMLALVLPPFGKVEGVPRGGLLLAEAMKEYATEGPLLLCDDVWTTGGSMERHRAGRAAFGGVLFARGQTPEWVRALLVVNPKLWIGAMP